MAERYFYARPQERRRRDASPLAAGAELLDEAGEAIGEFVGEAFEAAGDFLGDALGSLDFS